MKLFTYEVEGQPSVAVQHVCLQCDKPVLIDTAYLQAGDLYHCTYCGLDWRLPAESALQVAEQLAEKSAELLGVQPANA